MGDYLANNAYGFLPVPIVITEPAIGVGGGMLGMFLHESDEERESASSMH
ncbi:outer membrane protein [Vibrio variabilis]|uniref:Outer membrane protein n=1 Tax=Vibrio variabilis TaxID=990271 RepID=A0ABQ0JJD9_9VIBR|nr:outer membrane protein [Vibrio variabilis]